jgi:multiple sugar transport system substrate-binding protein
MDTNSEVGRWLATRRGRLGLTAEALAAHLGCPPETIARIEAGAAPLPAPLAGRLAGPLSLTGEQQAALVAWAQDGGLPPGALGDQAQGGGDTPTSGGAAPEHGNAPAASGPGARSASRGAVAPPAARPRRLAAGALALGLLALGLLAGGLALSQTPASGAPPATLTPALSGAGGLGAPFAPGAYKTNTVEPNATLRVSSWGDVAEQQVNRDSLARFQQVYPQVTVRYEPHPDHYQPTLKAQFADGSEPDVFYVDPGWAYELIPAGRLLDVTPALRETGRSTADYFPSLIGVFTGADGKTYGLPKDFGALAIFYNTDLVKRAPRPGWTQDDFRAFVQENASGSGASRVYGFASDPDIERWGAFALANGAKIIDNNKCAINSAVGVATLEYWYGLYTDHLAADTTDLRVSWTAEAFAKKQVAGVLQGGWMIPFLNDPRSAFGVHYDAAPIPLGKNGGSGNLLFFNAWGASARTKFPQAAAALVAFLASRENEDVVLQTGFALPALVGMENDPFFQGAGVVNRISALIYQSGHSGTPSYFGGKYDNKIKDIFRAATGQVFAHQLSPKAALDQACQAVDALLASGQ